MNSAAVFGKTLRVQLKAVGSQKKLNGSSPNIEAITNIYLVRWEGINSQREPAQLYKLLILKFYRLGTLFLLSYYKEEQ